jgi:acyl-homoserine lactone acylase PvdQ
MSTVWLENVLNQRPARWLPSAYKNYDELLVAALEAAANAPDAPKDLGSWTWGEFHAVDVEHPIFSHIPVLAGMAAPGRHKQSGSGLTVKAVGADFGPSERFTANPADWDQTTLNTTTGQSGQLFSEHNLDMWPLWYEGRTVDLPFTPAAVEKTKQHQLVLEPK